MFHDASVDRFTIGENELHLETEAFSVGPGETMLPARIVIGHIGAVVRNDEPVDGFKIESDDAEIYRLTSSPDGVELILIWHILPAAHSTMFAVYWFAGATLDTEALTGGPVSIVPLVHEH